MAASTGYQFRSFQQLLNSSVSNSLHILVLAWEFPPRVVGGIARHVAELYPELVLRGHRVSIVTVAPRPTSDKVDDNPCPEQEIVSGVAVYRVEVPEHYDFFEWVRLMNRNMVQYVQQNLEPQARDNSDLADLGDSLPHQFDLIHAHDWLVGEAAVALAETYNLPIIATIHATEYGRCNGIHNDTQRYIHNQELRLTQAAKRVIVCTKYMQGEVERALACLPNKTDIVPNGLSRERIQQIQAPQQTDFDRVALRAKYAQSHEALIYYVGRLTYEKGVSILLDAIPKILAVLPVQLVIIGTGDLYLPTLNHIIGRLGIGQNVKFTGFMSDADLYRLQTIADCAVFPSLYEPFGIVALESFAGGVPVVVSNTGGLPEVVRHEITGMVTQVNDSHSLAMGILSVLQNPQQRTQIVNTAKQELQQRFCWTTIAAQTEAIYHRLLQDLVSIT
ncbi:MAG: glycosyltransferase family 4 protein [Pseudanabaena sp. ELA607]